MRKSIEILVFSFLAMSAMASTSPVSEQQSGHIAEQVATSEGENTGFVAKALQWYDRNMNYTAVGLLMVIESSFIPFPSEVVIPPAVYVACNPESEGNMVVWLIIVVGTIGAVVGAFINYYLSFLLGRPVIYRFVDSKLGRLCGLSVEKMQRAEDFFNKHGIATTLIGRLIPGIRQLISIPAGLSRMNIGTFALFTAIGAGAWNCILALFGWIAYKAADPEIIARYSHQLSVILLALLAAGVLFIIAKLVWKKVKNNNQK